MALNNNPEQKRFMKFALVGLSGTIVDFVIFNLLTILVGFPTVPSSVFSFILAVFNNFFWNRQWTYPESKKLGLSGQFGKFAIVSVVGLAIRTIIFIGVEDTIIQLSETLFPSLPFTSEVIGHNITLASVIIIILFWNYFANKRWTYKGIEGEG